MRLTTPLITEARTAQAQSKGFEPKTSFVGLAARCFGDTAATEVSASFSVIGKLKEGEGQRSYESEVVLFGGASIISLSGTGTAQWTDRIADCVFSDLAVSMISLSTLTSFQASATEADV